MLRIRLVFSIADLHAQEEPEFNEENTEEEVEDAVGESYPIRCSFSIKKVCRCVALRLSWFLTYTIIAGLDQGCSYHRRHVPG